MGNEQMKLYDEGLNNGGSALEASQSSLDSDANDRVKRSVKKSNSVSLRGNYPKKPIRRITSMRGAKSKKSKSAESGTGSSSSSCTSSIAVDDEYSYLEDHVNGSSLINSVTAKKHRGAMSHGDLPDLIDSKHHTLRRKISESQEPSLSDDDPWRMQDSSEDCASSDSYREQSRQVSLKEFVTKESEIDLSKACSQTQSLENQAANFNENPELASNLNDYKNHRSIITKFPNYNQDSNFSLGRVLPEPVSLSDFVTWLEDRSQPLTSDQSSHKLQQFMQKGSGLDPFSEAQEEEIEKLATLDEVGNDSEDELAEAGDEGKVGSHCEVETENDSDDDGSIFSLEDILTDDDACENILVSDNVNDIDTAEQTKTRSKSDAADLLIQWLDSDKCKPPKEVSDKESISMHDSNQLDEKPCKSTLHELRVLGNDDYQNSELDKINIDACTNPVVSDRSNDQHSSKATPSVIKDSVELHRHVNNEKDVTLMAIQTSTVQFNDCQEVLCTNICACTDIPLNSGSNINGSPVQANRCDSESVHESSSFVVDVSEKMQERPFVEEACGVNHVLPASITELGTKINEYAEHDLVMAKTVSINNMGNEGSTEHDSRGITDNFKREEDLLGSREDNMTASVAHDNNKIADSVSLPEATTKERQKQRETNEEKMGIGIVVDVANNSNMLLSVKQSSTETIQSNMGAEHSAEKHSHTKRDFQHGDDAISHSAYENNDFHQHENEDINVLLEQDNTRGRNTSGHVINNSLVGDQDTCGSEPTESDNGQNLHEESINLEQSNLQAVGLPVIAENSDAYDGDNNSPSSSLPGSYIKLASNSESAIPSESTSTDIKGIRNTDGFKMSLTKEGPEAEMNDGRSVSVQEQEIDKSSSACSDVEILPHESCCDIGSSQMSSVGVDTITSDTSSLTGVNKNTMAKFDEQLRAKKSNMTDAGQDMVLAPSDISEAEEIKQLVEELCDNVTETKEIIASSLDPSLECTEQNELELQKGISDSNLPDQTDLIQMDSKLTNESSDAENDIKVSLDSMPSDLHVFGTDKQNYEHIAELSERKVNNDGEQFYGVGDRQLIIDHTELKNTESTDVLQPDTDLPSDNTEEYNSKTSSDNSLSDTDISSSMGNQPPGKAKDKKMRKKGSVPEETNSEGVVSDGSQEIADALEGNIETVRENEGQAVIEPNVQSETLLGSAAINRETPAVVMDDDGRGTKQQELSSATCLSDVSGSHTEHEYGEEMDSSKSTVESFLEGETNEISVTNKLSSEVETNLQDMEEISVEDRNETDQADIDAVGKLDIQVLDDTLATQTDGPEYPIVEELLEDDDANQKVDGEEYEEALHTFANDFVNEIIEAIITDGLKEEALSDSSQNSDEEIPFAAYVSEKAEVDEAAVQLHFQNIPRIEITDDSELKDGVSITSEEYPESDDIEIANEAAADDPENQFESELIDDVVDATVEETAALDEQKVGDQQEIFSGTETVATLDAVSSSDNFIQDDTSEEVEVASQTGDDEKVELERAAILETQNGESEAQHSDEVEESDEECRKEKPADKHGDSIDFSENEDEEKPDETNIKVETSDMKDEMENENVISASLALQNETENTFPLVDVNNTKPCDEREIKDSEYNETMETVANNETQALSEDTNHSAAFEERVDFTEEQNNEVPFAEEPMKPEDITVTDLESRKMGNREISSAENTDYQDSAQSNQDIVKLTEDISNTESVEPAKLHSPVKKSVVTDYYEDPEETRERLLLAKGERLLKKKQQLEKESIKWKITDDTPTVMNKF